MVSLLEIEPQFSHRGQCWFPKNLKNQPALAYKPAINNGPLLSVKMWPLAGIVCDQTQTTLNEIIFPLEARHTMCLSSTLIQHSLFCIEYDGSKRPGCLCYYHNDRHCVWIELWRNDNMRAWYHHSRFHLFLADIMFRTWRRLLKFMNTMCKDNAQDAGSSIVFVVYSLGVACVLFSLTKQSVCTYSQSPCTNQQCITRSASSGLQFAWEVFRGFKLRSIWK